MKNFKNASVVVGLIAAVLSGLVIYYNVQMDGIFAEQKLVAIATLVLINVCFAIIGGLELGRKLLIFSGIIFFVVILGLIGGFWNEGYGGWYYVLDPRGKFKIEILSVILSFIQGGLLLLGGIYGEKKKHH
jgi:hypothetical protein